MRRQADLGAGKEGSTAADPAPGDLLLMPETADRGLEWAVLAATPDDPRRVLLVPADTVPMIGSADVEVPAEEVVGPLSLRCRFAMWVRVDEGDLDGRKGTVGEPYVTAALEKHRALGAGKLRVSRSDDRITFHDPCYLSRHNRIESEARDALSSVAALVEMPRNRKCCAVISSLPDASRAAIMSRMSAGVGANGFSQMTCFPALRAATV